MILIQQEGYYHEAPEGVSMTPREALVNLANHLDVARMQANDIPETAYMGPVYTDITKALKDVLKLLVGDPQRVEAVYESVLNGNTAGRALEWEQGERDAAR